MNKGEHLLTILGEEASELAVQVSKTNRFGMDEQRDLPTSNRERLINEFNDVLAMAEMLNEEFGIGLYRDEDRIKAKIAAFDWLNVNLGSVDARPNALGVTMSNLKTGSDFFGVDLLDCINQAMEAESE